MRTQSEPQASGKATEARRQSEETAARIEEVLQSFDVLPSKVEQHIFRYGYLYLLALFLLLASDVLVGLWKYPQDMSSPLILLQVAVSLYALIGISIVLWAFNSWRGYVPYTLRDIFEQRRICAPTGDVNTHYLEFLERYRDALRSPKRYLLFGGLMIYMMIDFMIINVSFPHRPPHPIPILIIMLLSTVLLLNLGMLYYLGVQAWALSISGWYLRKLQRAFEFRIEPVHPDQCGGLEVLGNFCFRAVSPIVIGFAFIVSLHLVAGPMYPLNPVGVDLLAFFDLLYYLPLASVAFLVPLWNIHASMLGERKRAEETYAVHIAALREQIQTLLDNNQLEEAKALEEKKELIERLYLPHPTWPFNVKAQLFSTLLQAGGSLLLGYLTAHLGK